MRRHTLALLAGLLATSMGLAAPTEPSPAPVQVMVLGSYHFGNPGLDTHNMQVDSVLTPRKQAELDAVARALLAFKPSHVMVEMTAKGPALVVDSYSRFTPAQLLTEANEIVQIGFRTAQLAGLKVVHGIDEQPEGDEPDYYPFDKVQEAAKSHGQSAQLTALNAPVAAWAKAFEQRQKTETVAQLLISINGPAARAISHEPMYRMLALGDTEQQAGADLNAMWYLRNAKIFAKLMSLTRPGDRVLVLYGFGHGDWLRHFASETPGFRLVPVLPYLAKAQARQPRPVPAAAAKP